MLTEKPHFSQTRGKWGTRHIYLAFDVWNTRIFSDHTKPGYGPQLLMKNDEIASLGIPKFSTHA